jgi:hypothetical protein
MAVPVAAAVAWLPGAGRARAADPAEAPAKVFAAYDRQDSPGCSVGVMKDGAFVHLRGYGMANLEHGVPLGGDFAGRYYSPELDTAYAVEVKDGALFLRGRRLGGALTPSVRDEFTLGSMVLRFVRDAQGQPSVFLLGQGRVRNLKFARSEAP